MHCVHIEYTTTTTNNESSRNENKTQLSVVSTVTQTDRDIYFRKYLLYRYASLTFYCSWFPIFSFDPNAPQSLRSTIDLVAAALGFSSAPSFRSTLWLHRFDWTMLKEYANASCAWEGHRDWLSVMSLSRSDRMCHLDSISTSRLSSPS